MTTPIAGPSPVPPDPIQAQDAGKAQPKAVADSELSQKATPNPRPGAPPPDRVESSGSGKGPTLDLRGAIQGVWDNVAGDDIRTIQDSEAPPIARVGAAIDLGTTIADPAKGAVELGVKTAAKAAIKTATHVAEHSVADAATHNAAHTVAEGSTAASHASEGAGHSASAAIDLPPRTGKKTDGVLHTSDGQTLRLQSGYKGPAAHMPAGSPGFDLITKSHVEGHAAAYMQQNNIKEATVYINNPTVCPSCEKLLPRMLQPGSILHVALPSGEIRTFVGAAR